jgi:hypothetical protein
LTPAGLLSLASLTPIGSPGDLQNWCAASLPAADFAWPKRYDARSRSWSCRYSRDAPHERLLSVAAALLFLAVYSYPLPLALLLL